MRVIRLVLHLHYWWQMLCFGLGADPIGVVGKVKDLVLGMWCNDVVKTWYLILGLSFGAEDKTTTKLGGPGTYITKLRSDLRNSNLNQFYLQSLPLIPDYLKPATVEIQFYHTWWLWETSFGLIKMTPPTQIKLQDNAGIKSHRIQ